MERFNHRTAHFFFLSQGQRATLDAQRADVSEAHPLNVFFISHSPDHYTPHLIH